MSDNCRMKASDLSVDGFYWCSHDLCVWPIAAAEKGWEVVHLSSGLLWFTSAEVAIAICDVPDFTEFVGPIEPPSE